MSHPHPELSAPEALELGGLRITALGGLGEVGRNMTVFEYDDRLLIVDCGVLFPEDHHPGVDLILPDFSAIRDRLDQVEALVLTHGHEDHIGATPYLLRERGDIPLVGSELTLALLGSKLREHRLKETVHHKVREGDRVSFGPFDLEFVAVNHSIPDALAVAIRTGELEEHIVADIAWAAGCYVDWSGDTAFATGPGRELFTETARYWASRIRVDRSGRAHIYGVIGPDEYHEPVDDNAYTNVMAQWNLRRAAAAHGEHEKRNGGHANFRPNR